MIALALLVILAQPAQGRRAVRQDVTFAEGITRSRFDLSGTPDTRPDAPLFSFAVPAPGYKGYAASYAGLPATDGCYPAASVTGTKGEALTFTRATTRFCPTSANEATGVMCASGEVCITSSGTTRGISVFRAGTNLVLRSEEFDNAAWTKNGSVVAAPTVTANYATAPDGTLTADRLEIADCAGTTSGSSVYQAVGASGTLNNSIWVKANTGTPSVSLCSFAATGICTPIALTAAWKRFDVTYTGTAGSNYLNIGCENRTALYSGASNSGAADISVWGAMIQQSQYPTPYVATTSASATRNREDATFPVASATPACMGVTWVSPPRFAVARNRALGTVRAATGTNLYEWYTPSDATTGVGTCDWYVAGSSFTGATSNSMTAGNTMRLSCEYNGTNLTAGLDGTYNGTARTMTPWTQASTYYVGNYSSEGGYHADGLLSNILIDTSPTRCR